MLDTLALYPWSGSVSWCLTDDYGNGDQRHLMGHHHVQNVAVWLVTGACQQD